MYINAHVENGSYANVRGTFRCYQLKINVFRSDTPVGGWTSTLPDPYFYFAFYFSYPSNTHTQAVYQKILQLSYVDKLIDQVHLVFRDKYKNELATGPYQRMNFGADFEVRETFPASMPSPSLPPHFLLHFLLHFHCHLIASLPPLLFLPLIYSFPLSSISSTLLEKGNENRERKGEEIEAERGREGE